MLLSVYCGFTAQFIIFPSVLLFLGIALCRERVQCLIVEKKKKKEDAASLLPVHFPHQQ